MQGQRKPAEPDKASKRILVAVSGGIHGLVAAGLLRSQGYEVHALLIQLAGPEGGFDARCARPVGPDGVAAFCESAGIAFHLADARGLYRERVLDYFVHECLQNRLPNPCIPCNHEVKIRVLREEADRLGIHWLATGHAADVVQDATTGLARLRRATDSARDQSYFLYALGQDVLQRLLLPLGGLQEAMVGKLAREFRVAGGGVTEARCDACYVDDPRARDFVDRNTPPSLRAKGMIRSTDGIIVGEHEGLHRYSIGQSEGLDITVKGSENLYVVGFDPSRQALVVGPESLLFHRLLTASRAAWVSPQDGLRALRCRARVHPRGEPAACSVTLFENATVQVSFDQPQRAVCAGQAVVFYDGEDVLGGAVIEGVGEEGARA